MMRRIMVLVTVALVMAAMMVAMAAPAIGETTSPSPTADATAVGTSAASAQYAQYKTITALPSTGGPGLPSGVLAIGAGALLVGGGLVARRIVR